MSWSSLLRALLPVRPQSRWLILYSVHPLCFLGGRGGIPVLSSLASKAPAHSLPSLFSMNPRVGISEHGTVPTLLPRAPCLPVPAWMASLGPVSPARREVIGACSSCRPQLYPRTPGASFPACHLCMPLSLTTAMDFLCPLTWGWIVSACPLGEGFGVRLSEL